MSLHSAGGGAKSYQFTLSLALHAVVPLALGIIVAVSRDLTLEGPSGPGFWLPLLATLAIVFVLTAIEARAIGQTSPTFLPEGSSLLVDLFAGVLLFWTGLLGFTAGVFIPHVLGWGSLGLDDLCGQYTLEGCDPANDDFGEALLSWSVAAAYLSVPLGAAAGATGWVSRSFLPK